MSTEPITSEAASGTAMQTDLRDDLYRAIFDHSREPIAILDPQGRYLEQNDAHAQLLGYTDEDLRNQTPAIHSETFADLIRIVAETGEYRGEVTNRTKSGEVKQIELSAFAMRSESGEPLCYVGIKRDITERKQAEAAL